MIDLTPLDVRKKRGDFRRTLRGYDPEEVDAFMDLVAERFEELVRQNLILTERTDSLESQLEALSGRESAVQEALVSAQKLREEVNDQSRREAETLKAQARREADLLRSEAEAQISNQIAEADVLVRERQVVLEDLERSRLKFLKSFRGLLERELDAVEVEEARRPLEDTPLDLDLKGLMFQGEPGEEEEEEDVGDSPDGFETQILGGAEAAGPSSAPEEDLPPTTGEEPAPIEELAPDEGSVTVEGPTPIEELAPVEEPDESSPVDIEGLAPSESDSVDQVAPESPEEVMEEPKWLFSLLKKDEKGTGGEE